MARQVASQPESNRHRRIHLDPLAPTVCTERHSSCPSLYSHFGRISRTTNQRPGYRSWGCGNAHWQWSLLHCGPLYCRRRTTVVVALTHLPLQCHQHHLSLPLPKQSPKPCSTYLLRSPEHLSQINVVELNTKFNFSPSQIALRTALKPLNSKILSRRLWDGSSGLFNFNQISCKLTDSMAVALQAFVKAYTKNNFHIIFVEHEPNKIGRLRAGQVSSHPKFSPSHDSARKYLPWLLYSTDTSQSMLIVGNQTDTYWPP